jgi:hypothetical protein
MKDFSLFRNHLLRVNDKPVTPQAGNTLLRSADVAGPDEEGDRRIFLDAKMLEQLLEMARKSPTQRVRIDRAGVRVELWRNAEGRDFEVWTFTGINPHPERFLA